MIRNRQYGTTPLVFHNAGPATTRTFRQICKAFFARPAQKIGSIPDLTILTWNNGAPRMGLFERSCDHLGIPVLVLGSASEWSNLRKLSLTAGALESITSTWVMAADSRDAILWDNPIELPDMFDCDLMFSADHMTAPDMILYREIEDRFADKAGAGRFRYLNSGMWIGVTAFCREFFGAAARMSPMKSHPLSDQGILKPLFHASYPKVQLDYRSTMFQNMDWEGSPVVRL